MKTIVIALMMIQVFCYTYGVYQVLTDSPYWGILNMTLNAAFFVVNIYTLKDISSYD